MHKPRFYLDPSKSQIAIFQFPQCAGMRIYENFRIAQTPFHVRLQNLRRKMSKIFFESIYEKKILYQWVKKVIFKGKSQFSPILLVKLFSNSSSTLRTWQFAVSDNTCMMSHTVELTLSCQSMQTATS